jgi:hypothetical protein
MNLTGVFVGRPVMNTLAMPGAAPEVMAANVATGDLVSQLLTLYIRPVFYLNMARVRGLTGSMRRRGAPARMATGVAASARS